MAGVALLTGLLINLLVVLGLGLAGRYWPIYEVPLLAGIGLLGVILGRPHLGLYSRTLKPLGALAAAWVVLAILLTIVAPPSAWIRGGWDPGVYVNEGLALARTGSFAPEDRFFHEQLDDDGRWAFTRTGQGRTERFPGVLVESDRQAFGFEFFRLMPSAVGLMGRGGGVEGALAVNAALGALALLLLITLLAVHADWAHGLWAALLLVTQPLWLYHAHTPVSEMLQLCLVLGVGLLLPVLTTGRLVTALSAFFLLGLVLNRFSFLPFGALLVVWCIYDHLKDHDRKAVGFVLIAGGTALAVGAGIDTAIAPASLINWYRWGMLHLILAVTLAGLVTALVLHLGAGWLRKLPLHVFTQRYLRTGMYTAAVAALFALWLYGRENGGDGDADNAFRLLSYLGRFPTLLALAGGWIAFSTARSRQQAWHIFTLFLFTATVVLLARKQIVDWYPWATRRYLPVTVPLLAILGSLPLARLVRAPYRFLGLAAALAITLVLLQAPACRQAARHTEYAGLDDTLERLVMMDMGFWGEPRLVVVTDDPRWGTPLALTYGLQVLNGKHLWRTPEKVPSAVRALDQLAANGFDVCFLTSTPAGGSLYPEAVSQRLAPSTGKDALFADGQLAMAYTEIQHHPRSDNFTVRFREVDFRKYTWKQPGGATTLAGTE